jgi:hypothetical protein
VNSRQQSKVNFLREHPELWALSPQEIVLELKKALLVSSATYWKDVHVLEIVESARKEADRMARALLEKLEAEQVRRRR